MEIWDVKNPWRQEWKQAHFRGAEFFVETNARSGGRRVALHQYPKRNLPYAEDMGRTAFQINVQGYCIGPEYLHAKNLLIMALEADGPGTLSLPLQYNLSDVNVMVQQYSVTESRERGGVCTFDMSFVEYGDPKYREVAWTPGAVDQAATNAEKAVAGPGTETTGSEVTPYNDVWVSGVDPAADPVNTTVIGAP